MTNMSIPRSFVVNQFDRVSPSRYTSMKSCLLSEVFTASKNEPLLPPSPFAKLGSVIHKLLRAAGSGKLNVTVKENLDAAWREMISNSEETMIASALTRHLVPLSRSVPDLEVRKFRTFRKAFEIGNDVFRRGTSTYVKTSESKGTEVWIESRDGRLGGYIDCVTITNEGVILSEYKTGAVLDYRTRNDTREVKQSYEEQLKLYAYLYHDKFGVWPFRLEIVPLQRSPIEVLFEHKDAERLFEEATTYLLVANERIKKVKEGKAALPDLASPGPKHCRFCLFRPACSAYWIARRVEPDEKWPIDVRGYVKQVISLRNGKICVTLSETSNPESTVLTIRNLTKSTNRHPSLNHIESGTHIAIYGLKYHYQTGDYSETPYTFIHGAELGL
jgi:PD-(D/E)XK nuclease superfamily